MRILVDPAAAKDKACYARAADAVQRRERGVVLTIVRSGRHAESTCRWVLEEAILSETTFPGAESIQSCLEHEAVRLFTEGLPDTDVLVEPVIPKPLLLIAGGGHVGQAVAIQASLVGFDVTVIDERPEFTDPVLFPEGTRTYCGDMVKQTAALIADDTYVVIVTRGHKLDAEVLEACIHSRATYVGMIGSKRKVGLMRRHFIESGLATEQEFDRVFTPIGLDIGAVTVPEIATSITAELIAVRRKGIIHEVPGIEDVS
jgi:xanthine/CO dehydrogenase XdhC/CoxF family maturation factor